MQLTAMSGIGHDGEVTCDHCKTAIERGEQYSITEFGRTHAHCLRLVANPNQNVLGPLIPARRELRLERNALVYVLQRL